MATIDKRPLKGYVRFDGRGRIVPSSLILRRKMPKVGKWIEVPQTYQCCNPTTTSTTIAPIPPCTQYVLIVTADVNVTLSYTNCDGTFISEIIGGPSETLFCAQMGSASVRGIGVILALGSCSTTTTTTTLFPTTTTTTTTEEVTTTTTTTETPTTTTTTTAAA